MRKSCHHTQNRTALRPSEPHRNTFLIQCCPKESCECPITTCVPPYICSTTCPRAAKRILRRRPHHITVEHLKMLTRSNWRRSIGTPSRGTDSCYVGSQLFGRVDSDAGRTSVSHPRNASISCRVPSTATNTRQMLRRVTLRLWYSTHI